MCQSIFTANDPKILQLVLQQSFLIRKYKLISKRSTMSVLNRIKEKQAVPFNEGARSVSLGVHRVDGRAVSLHFVHEPFEGAAGTLFVATSQTALGIVEPGNVPSISGDRRFREVPVTL